jgi:hypothetical protein
MERRDSLTDIVRTYGVAHTTQCGSTRCRNRMPPKLPGRQRTRLGGGGRIFGVSGIFGLSGRVEDDEP